MSDTSGGTSGSPQGNGSNPQQPAAGGAPSFQIAAQYVKDLSFENPGSPATQVSGRPAIEVGLDVQARPMGGDQYEVAIRVRVNAKSDQTAVFLVELLYGGLFVVKNMPVDRLQPFLLIEGPRQLFPFVRRIVADVTRDGGFLPLMLEPIDFAELYRQQAQTRAQQTAAAPAEKTPT
jgi:preprotein translocase subunit SecB